MTSRRILVVVTAFAAVLVASPAMASTWAKVDRGAVTLSEAIDSAHGGGQKSGTGRAHAAPAREYYRAPDCPANNPGAGRIETCANATLSCPEPEVRMRTWSAAPGTSVGSGSWTAGASTCVPPDQPAVPRLSLEDFRRLPLPPGTSVVQPPTRDVLIRMPTNAYAASTSAVELTTELLGQPVRVRATPVAWSFDYGDGAVVGPSEDPGGPYPRLTTAHEYTRPGAYEIVMTTHYSGEYSVAGGAWVPVVGRASVRSPGHSVVAHSAVPSLIAGDD